MNARLLPALIVGLVLPLSAAETKPAVSKAVPVTATFYINEVKCSTCVNALEESLRKLPTVTKVDNLSESTGLAVVTFDPKTVSYQQVAQAIFATAPVHNDPYTASLKFTISDYAKGDNAAKLNALFAKHKHEVRVEVKNKARGECVLFFEQLRVIAGKKGPQGWNLDEFVSAIQEPAPKGLGLTFALTSE